MSLEAGSKLGHYEITAMIGKGGMGEVYKAHDPRVGRDVAIKVSAQQFSERFEREVRAIAALNHPNICTLYDVGPNFLVMEFVDGASPKGPMPLDEALRIADQIAAALEAAHEKNITHRDLKPGNVMVKADGLVKVLDFGLAKMAPETPSEADATLTIGATQPGAIMGTPAYMAPEQARGKPADKRADIWAFGVVVHELLTGQRLFKGEDLTEVLASVVKDAPDLNVVPLRVRRMLAACLQKDPKKRLQSIADVRLLLDAESGTEVPLQAKARPPFLAWGVAGVAVIVAILLWAPWRAAPALPTPVRFEIAAPPKTIFTNWMTLSPDGKTVGFTARGEDGELNLWLRPLDSLQARPLATTSNYPVPFWSPDSHFIAYQLNGKLRKIDVSGGPSQILCDAPGVFLGGTWSADGVIVFGSTEGLTRVPAAGGMPTKLTTLDPARQETAHAAPVFLPDGKHFLYERQSGANENNGIYTGSLDDSPDRQPGKALLLTSSNGLFMPSHNGGPSYLVFKRENALMAQPFDPKTLELSGEPAPVANPVGTMGNRLTNAAVSTTGVLAYKATGQADQRVLTMYDHSGAMISAISSPAQWVNPSLSPDGTRVAAAQTGTGNEDIQLLDLPKKLVTRFTFDPAEDNNPIWSPDGSRVVFSSLRAGKQNLYWKVANGARDEEILLDTPEPKVPLDWSRDGKYLLFSSVDPKNREDIWYLPMTPEKSGEAPKPVRFLGTQFRETGAKFSPDGRFVAYISDESGTNNEVYVRTFPDGNGRWQVSVGGGGNPRWRRDGKELFFGRGGLEVRSVEITAGATFQASAPKVLFSVPFNGIDVSADGKQILLGASTQAAANDPIIVVLNAFH